MYTFNPTLLWTIAALFVALIGGTLVRIVALRGATREVAEVRFASLKSWWVLAAILGCAVIFGKAGVAVMLAIAAILSLREFIDLTGWDGNRRTAMFVVSASVLFYYFLSLSGMHELLRQAAPVAVLIVVGSVRSWLGLTADYIRTTSAMVWAYVLFVCCLSHAYLLLELPDSTELKAGSAGWFLFLVILTEVNDIMQAIVGRRFGRTKITPRVSPNKSLEGLLGGIISTTILAVLMSPWLTTFASNRTVMASAFVSAGAGFVISVFGFFGDINMSSMKRDAGVKDGSRLIPGQGGMIDRIDSLTFTAPVFFYYVRTVTS
jgi:phosphatidate cytidylyltransferase